jgi:hypothetical protein
VARERDRKLRVERSDSANTLGGIGAEKAKVGVDSEWRRLNGVVEQQGNLKMERPLIEVGSVAWQDAETGNA